MACQSSLSDSRDWQSGFLRKECCLGSTVAGLVLLHAPREGVGRCVQILGDGHVLGNSAEIHGRAGPGGMEGMYTKSGAE